MFHQRIYQHKPLRVDQRLQPRSECWLEILLETSWQYEAVVRRGMMYHAVSIPMAVGSEGFVLCKVRNHRRNTGECCNIAISDFLFVVDRCQPSESSSGLAFQNSSWIMSQ